MLRKIIGYLEEYARKLSDERNALIDAEITDKDALASKEVREVQAKIREIRGIIVFLTNNPRAKISLSDE